MSASEGSTVTLSSRRAGVRPRSLLRFARKLQAQVARGRSFDCLITGDADMRRLNREFRGKDYATDVLSFPADRSSAYAGSSSRRAGDIAISLSRARAQARQFGHSTEQEIRILMLHGLLHLMGDGSRKRRRPDGTRGKTLARAPRACRPD